MRHSNLRSISSKEARDVIESVWATVKMISAPIEPSIENRSWNLIIAGLNEPHKNRFVKPLDRNVIRERRYNFQTREWENRSAHPERGRDKDTEFTKKTAMTLIPPRANITLYSPRYGTPIGLLLDWRLCHRKDDRYIFERNIGSDNKPWLARYVVGPRLPKGIHFLELQKRLRELGPRHLAEQNELLGGLHRNAVIGVVAPENTLRVRINALAKKNLLLQEAQLDVPIFIFDREMGVLDYSPEMQRADISIILNSSFPESIKRLAESCVNTYDITPKPSLSQIAATAPPLELLEQDKIQPVPPVKNGTTPKDLRRFILFRMDFLSLVSLRQQISEKGEPALLKLKADLTVVIKCLGPLMLHKILEIKVEHVGLSYQMLLELYLPALQNKWSDALKADEDKKILSAMPMFPHLLLANSRHLKGVEKIYAYVGRPEKDTWGTWEMKYREGIYFQFNLLFAGLGIFPKEELQKLIMLYPAWLNSTFQNLQMIYCFALRNRQSVNYKLMLGLRDISNKWKTFVQIASRELLMGTYLDLELKKITLDVVLDKIALLTSLEELHQVYGDYANSPWFSMARNPNWDMICSLFHPKRWVGEPTYPNAQREIIELLQKRACDLLIRTHYSIDDVHVLIASPLFAQDHIRRGVSEENYLKLEHLSKSLQTMSSFF